MTEGGRGRKSLSRDRENIKREKKKITVARSQPETKFVKIRRNMITFINVFVLLKRKTI